MSSSGGAEFKPMHDSNQVFFLLRVRELDSFGKNLRQPKTLSFLVVSTIENCCRFVHWYVFDLKLASLFNFTRFMNLESGVIIHQSNNH
jgi:hypothetical protein